MQKQCNQGIFKRIRKVPVFETKTIVLAYSRSIPMKWKYWVERTIGLKTNGCHEQKDHSSSSSFSRICWLLRKISSGIKHRLTTRRTHMEATLTPLLVKSAAPLKRKAQLWTKIFKRRRAKAQRATSVSSRRIISQIKKAHNFTPEENRDGEAYWIK